MDNIHDRLRKQKPYLTDWSVMITVVMTMQQIFGSILKTQTSDEKWLISESIVDTEGVYIFFNGDDMDEVCKVELEQMVKEQDHFAY